MEDCQELCVRIDPNSCGFTKDDSVVITGDFDNWNPGQYPLAYDPTSGYFTVHLPYDGISETFVCKFVVNGHDWRALNCFDTFTDDMGHENNLLHCKAWLETEEMVADIVMEDIELDLKPFSSSSLTPSDLPMEQLDLDGTNCEHDYIHVTSRGELSSSEDVELDPRIASGAIDDMLDEFDTTQQSQNAESQSNEGSSYSEPNERLHPSSHNPIHGLVATLRRASTYWKR